MKEFIKKLSVETPLDYSKATTLVTFICNKVGTLDTAYKIYNKSGVIGLEIYVRLLALGVKY